MAANLSSQVVATQLEQISPQLGYFLTKLQSNFAKKFQNNVKKHRVSAWTAGSGAVQAWRIPILQSNGGDYAALNLDSGDLGTGSMMQAQYMALSYFASNTAFYVPALAAMATKTNKQAAINVLETSISSALRETALYGEIGLFQDGTGVLATGNGTGSPSGTNPTYQLDPQFSINRLRGYNALVDVYDTTFATKKGTGLRVTNINFTSSPATVTLTGTVTSPVNTDVIAFPGMSPTLTSTSWRSGLYTYNTTNTSGSLNGLSYASVYELACPAVNAAGGAPTASVLFAGKSQLIQRRDDQAFASIEGVCHPAQRTAWYLQGVTIANQFLRPGDSAKNIDLAGQGTTENSTFEACDVMHSCSRYASKTRIDWFNAKNFGKVNLDDIAFYQTPDGQRIFTPMSTTTGNTLAAFQFYITNTENLYTIDPGCSVVFYGLGIPALQ